MRHLVGERKLRQRLHRAAAFLFDVPDDQEHFGLAQRHPEIDFMIKPKAKHYERWWLDVLNGLLAEAHVGHENISNLQIVPYADVHDLIFEADVVVVAPNSPRSGNTNEGRVSELDFPRCNHLFEIVVGHPAADDRYSDRSICIWRLIGMGLRWPRNFTIGERMRLV